MLYDLTLFLHGIFHVSALLSSKNYNSRKVLQSCAVMFLIMTWQFTVQPDFTSLPVIPSQIHLSNMKSEKN